MHFVIFLSIVAFATADTCYQQEDCKSCVRSGCVYGIDFQYQGVCITEDEAEELPLSKIVHSVMRCDSSVVPIPPKSMERLNIKKLTTIKPTPTTPTTAPPPTSEMTAIFSLKPEPTTIVSLTRATTLPPPPTIEMTAISSLKPEPTTIVPLIRATTDPPLSTNHAATSYQLTKSISIVPEVVIEKPSQVDSVSSAPTTPTPSNPTTMMTSNSVLPEAKPNSVESFALNGILMGAKMTDEKMVCPTSFTETPILKMMRTFCRANRMAKTFKKHESTTRHFDLWVDLSPVQHESNVCQQLVWMKRHCK